MLKRMVWAAVVAVALALGAVIAAVVGDDNNLVISLGAAAITAAILATRER
jgi:hypothetical protein